MNADTGQGLKALQRPAIAVAIAIVLAAVAASLPRDNIFQGWIADLSVGVRAAVFGIEDLDSGSVLVIGEDARSLAAPELQNRPRALFSPVYAELAEKLLAAGGRGLILDIILNFDAKDLRVGDETPLRGYDVPMLKLLRAERDRGRLVLGRSSELLPARRFARMAGENGLAMVQVPFGASNVIRTVPTRLLDVDGAIHPTLSGRGAFLAGQTDLPDQVRIMPTGPLTTLPSVSLIDVLRCGDAAALRRLFDGRVVFIGGMLPSEDRLKTPDQYIRREVPRSDPIDPADTSVACDFAPPHTRLDDDPTLPGVYIHAAAVDAMVGGWAVREVSRAVEVALVFAAAIVAASLAFLFTPVFSAGLLAVLIGSVFATVVTALEFGFYLPASWAMAAAPLALVLGYGVRLRLVDRKSNMIRREFGRYLSPVLVQQMVDRGQMPGLGGEEREVTVMFADLTGFTAISESTESARLVRLLNRYLDTIAGVVRDHGGYVDKFIGDAVMAMFNAPVPVDNHALKAVSAAHEILRRVEEMAAHDIATGDPHFEIKVGLSTGRATVGNVGSSDRVNYTVVGENVNLAARFESLPGVLGTPIVIGPEAAKRVAGEFYLLRMCAIRVKGKAAGVSVFAPLPFDQVTDETVAISGRYDQALSWFEAGAFAAAAELWSELATMSWPGAGPARAMAREAEALASGPIQENWDGVFEMRSK
ncbi:MAG: adenylate/guanylate cyclase domain-containing protein [Pseudomonadota bacterium]